MSKVSQNVRRETQQGQNGIPTHLYMEADLTTYQATAVARMAVDIARRNAPKFSGGGARAIQALYGQGFFGLRWEDPHVWYQEVGIRPFTMNRLAGKAQPLTEPVLTPCGWSKMDDIKVGDYVIGSNGEPTEVLGTYPQGELDAWRVTFNDRTSVLCSEDHLWTVFRDGNTSAYRNSPQVRTTRELMKVKKTRVWAVPTAGPVEYAPQAPLPIDPYLMGVLISEGCRGSSPAFAQQQSPVVDEVRKVLPSGVSLSPSGNGMMWTITAGARGNTENPVGRALRDLGLSLHQDSSTDLRACPECGATGTRRGEFKSSRAVLIHRGKAHGVRTDPHAGRVYGLYSYQKFIPDVALTSSVEDRTSLLQGLMDGDGSCPKMGAIKYHTSSPRLAEDVMELARSLGGLARMSSESAPRAHSRRIMHAVQITMPEGVEPFRAKLDKKLFRYHSSPSRRYVGRKRITSIEREGATEMQCIRVAAEDSLYVTSGFTLTHNTIPMWIKDPTGEERRKNPKAKTQQGEDGVVRVLIFRRAAKQGQRKIVMDKGVEKSVPMSYPGAPGRINVREIGRGMTREGKVAGRIAGGLDPNTRRNVGVRWRHPGLVGRSFLHRGMVQAAVHYGLDHEAPVWATTNRWR